VPAINIFCERTEFIDTVWNNLKEHDVCWIHGAPSEGKSSVAILSAKKASGKTLWIECRDVPQQQLSAHIINSLAQVLKTPITSYYQETVDNIITAIDQGTLLIFNDFPNIEGNDLLQQHFAYLLLGAASKGLYILVTTNHPVPINLADKYEVEIYSTAVPPFNEEDTSDLLEYLGASKETAELLTGIVTRVTEGHPLLIHSAAKYLQQKEWSLDEDVIKNIFIGKFGDIAERESYHRVLMHTTDADTRDLLYRLRCVVGDFDMGIIRRLAAVAPEIMHPGEKINQIKGIWLQNKGDGKFQLSPLVKRLEGNLQVETERNVYTELGLNIIQKKNISQTEALAAIYYFNCGHEYNHAALVLYRVLTEFANQPKLFFEWGFELYWWNQKFPEEVLPFLKVQIRALQISAGQGMKKNIDFLVEDLQQIIANEDIGLLGKVSSELSFFQLEFVANPIAAFEHLSNAQAAYKQIEIPELGPGLITDEVLNGIWFIFSFVHTRRDYEDWFRFYTTIDAPKKLSDPNSAEFYIMAAVSIYRNAILKNKGFEEDIAALLRWLIDTAYDNKLFLLSAFALKYLSKYLIEEKEDWNAAVDLIKTYENVWSEDPIYKFLLYAEIGTRYFYAGQPDTANSYFEEVKNVDLPPLYSEGLDYLIAYSQSSFINDPEYSAELADKALKKVMEGQQYALDDKVKLYGEAAIGAVNTNKRHQALHLYEAGYVLLLENFSNSEGQQAMVIRYGNAIKYVVELLETGQATSFGGDKFVIPTPGYFYRTNENLLAGGYYFDERKFMVASGLQDGFESIGDIARAKKWAYKCIELSLELTDPKYIAILERNIFYLVQDRLFRQAYNIKAHIEAYYVKLKEKVEKGEEVGEGIKGALEKVQLSDLGMYFFVLLPISLLFSQDIVQGRVQRDQYRYMIDDAFSNDQYKIKDVPSYEFAKRLFEKIMLENISYQEMQEFFQTYNGEHKDILYTMGCLLLSSFKQATEAANLHLAVVIVLEQIFKQMKAIYRFCLLPYFEDFWKYKITQYPQEFAGPEILRTSGLTLIEKTSVEKRIAAIFLVLSKHLRLNITDQAREFMNSGKE
jgi:hypothetical protein